VCLSLKFEGEKRPGYKKGQDAAQNVKGQVYQVITPNIEPVKMVVDGKGEHGKNPGNADVRTNSFQK
jgi:hypothetical protein